SGSAAAERAQERQWRGQGCVDGSGEGSDQGEALPRGVEPGDRVRHLDAGVGGLLAALSRRVVEMPAVYLKADDLRLDAVSKNWKRFLSFCASEGIHCNAGVIARNTPALDGARVNEVRAELDALGFGRSWTVWNHGVDHRRVRETHTSDFCGMPLASQIDALRRAQDFVERLTGVRMNAFGAPFNWWDHN